MMSDSLPNVRLSFIGGGNMARSLIGGLITRGAHPDQITVADAVTEQRRSLTESFGVLSATDNVCAARAADVVILAVKPQDLRNVMNEIRACLTERRPLLISIAAGIRASDIQSWAGGVPVVRCMPNRPALHGCGITGLFATSDVPTDGRSLAATILGAVGRTLWLECEADMDTVTAISGSGPAYFFLLIEMLEQAGIALGLPPEVSRKLAAETAYGSGSMARDMREAAATLREQVTSKGGTTEVALKHLEASNVRGIFYDAIAAAARRSAQLADELAR
jgi:pyrroline-5-carboxylate reductase